MMKNGMVLYTMFGDLDLYKLTIFALHYIKLHHAPDARYITSQ